jgi:hypothetical protein
MIPKAVTMNIMKAAEELASGQVRFHQNYAAYMWLNKQAQDGRAQVSPEYELFLWERFDVLCQELFPKVRFGRDMVCNTAERYRRNAMFGLFNLVDFRSEDPKIKETFQRNFGQVSLAWMINECKTNAPPFYYEWAFDAIQEISRKTWGAKALHSISTSLPHREVFQKLAPEKFNQLAVKRVMES